MSNSRKKNRLPLIVGSAMVLLSLIFLIVATAVGWIPADVESKGTRFGSLAALYTFLAAFVPDPGLSGGGKVWWPDTMSVGAITGMTLFLVLLAGGIALIVISAKKKNGKIPEIAALIVFGFYLGYLTSFSLNGLLRENMLRNASFWLLSLFALAIIGYAFILFGMIRGFSPRVEEVAEETSAPALPEATIACITSEEYKKAKANVPESVEEGEILDKVETALAEHEQTSHGEKEEPSPVQEEPVEEKEEEVQVEEPLPAEEPAEEKEVEEAEQPSDDVATAKLSGKYEVFPEAGFFKYRLKANNGQILLVSNNYKTQAGAIRGIDTLRKNVEVGTHRVVVDKKGRGQFRIFTANDARLVVAGEIYPDAAGAQKALDSVLRFYGTDKIVKLDEIPAEEIREWAADLSEIKPTPNGKIEINLDEAKKYFARFRASNGEILFETVSYVNKGGLLSGVAIIKEKVLAGNVSVVCDKQGSYQFKVYSDNGMVLVMGQTYPAKESALSAAKSTANFLAGEPKVVDLTKAETPAE